MTEENSVQVYESQAVAPVQARPLSVLEIIARAASDPTCDVAKMDRLLAMKERLDAKEAKKQFDLDRSKVQPLLPRVGKDGTILNNNGTVRNKYAKYEDIDEASRQILAEHGFTTDFDTEDAPAGSMKIVMNVTHTGGHSEKRSITLPIDKGAGRNDVQSCCSTYTYGQRHLFKNYWNIITVGADKDGNGTGGAISGDQIKVIEDLLVATKSNRQKFCEHFHVEDVSELPASQYERAAKMLAAKKVVR